MDEVYIYCIALPEGVNEMVVPCFGGYTIYISDRLDREHRVRAYHHALRHIKSGDFEKAGANRLELFAHRV